MPFHGSGFPITQGTRNPLINSSALGMKRNPSGILQLIISFVFSLPLDSLSIAIPLCLSHSIATRDSRSLSLSLSLKNICTLIRMQLQLFIGVERVCYTVSREDSIIRVKPIGLAYEFGLHIELRYILLGRSVNLGLSNYCFSPPKKITEDS